MTTEGDHEEKGKAVGPLTAALHRKHIKQLYEGINRGVSLSGKRASSLRSLLGILFWVPRAEERIF